MCIRVYVCVCVCVCQNVRVGRQGGSGRTAASVLLIAACCFCPYPAVVEKLTGRPLSADAWVLELKKPLKVGFRLRDES
jgi:hypothetical protein